MYFLRKIIFYFPSEERISNFPVKKQNNIFPDNTRKIIFQCDIFGKIIFSENLEKENMAFCAVSFLLLPNIASPSRTTATSATLTENTFSNNYNSLQTSGNLVITLNDHHAQLLMLGNQHNSFENNKEDQLYRDFQEIKKKQSYNI